MIGILTTKTGLVLMITPDQKALDTAAEMEHSKGVTTRLFWTPADENTWEGGPYSDRFNTAPDAIAYNFTVQDWDAKEVNVDASAPIPASTKRKHAKKATS